MLGDSIHVPEVTSNGTGDFAATQPLWPSRECPKCAELLKAMKMARDYSPGHGMSYEILDNAISKAYRK